MNGKLLLNTGLRPSGVDQTCLLSTDEVPQAIRKVDNSLDILEEQSSPRKLALEALDDNSRTIRESEVDRR